MSEQLDELDLLIEAVESGRDIYPSDFPPDFRKQPWAIRAYEGSLDAAQALHEALLPGWVWEVNTRHAWVSSPPRLIAEYVDGSPARAWLLAILRAYRSTLTDTSNGGE